MMIDVDDSDVGNIRSHELYLPNCPGMTLKNFASHDITQYSRALEHILQTTPPALLLRDDVEIFETLDLVSKYADQNCRVNLINVLYYVCSRQITNVIDISLLFGYNFLHKVIDIVCKYLLEQIPIRTDAFRTLMCLISNGYLDQVQINVEETICPTIIQLIDIDIAVDNGDDSGDIHTNAIGIMAKIAPKIGSEKTNTLFYDKFIHLTTSKIHFVRKQCAGVFPVLCQVLGNEIVEKNMLPIFLKLCKDEIWGVRKACCEVFPMISLMCSMESRRKYLVPTIKELLNDSSSEWVKASAYESLGKFLTTFAQPPIIELGYNSNYDLSIMLSSNNESRKFYASNLSLYENQFSQNVAKDTLCSIVYEQKEYSITNKIECLATYKNLFSEMLKIDYDFDFPGYNYGGNDGRSENNNNSSDNVFTPSTSSSKELTKKKDSMQKNRRFRRILNQVVTTDDINDNSMGLDEFNSHQYWYIKPAADITLDLDLFEIGVVATAQDDDNNSNKTLIYESDAGSDVDNISAVELNDTEEENQIKSFLKNIDIKDEIEWTLLKDYANTCYEFSNVSAYYFPGVLLAAGDRFWDQMFNLFWRLCQFIDLRKIFAASICQIALIIGPERTNRDLVKCYLLFMMDDYKVLIEAIKNMANFMQLVDQSVHEKLIRSMRMCLEKKSNDYKVREAISQQLIVILKRKEFPKKQIGENLLRMAMYFIQDRYNHIRLAGIESFVVAFSLYANKEQLLRVLYTNLYKKDWRARQHYIMTVNKLLKDDAISGEMFHRKILKKILDLSRDSIPNIRITVAKCLTETVLKHSFFQTNDNNDYYKIWLCLSKLQNDNDRDVRDLAKLLPLPETITMEMLNDVAIADMQAARNHSVDSSDEDHTEEDEINKSLYGLGLSGDGEDEEDDVLADLQLDINLRKSGVTGGTKNTVDDTITILFASSSFENEDSLFTFNDDDTNCNEELPELPAVPLPPPPAPSTTNNLTCDNVNSLPPPPPLETTNDCDSNKNFDFNLSSSSAKKEAAGKKI